jgi:putative ABC transport system substrate-binding protein
MKRREFITLLSGAAAAWPLAAGAQLTERVRRIGLLMVHVESDQEGQTLAAAFREGLLKSGWTEGRNIRIDTRWAGGDLGRARSLATELVALAPDVIVTGGASYVTALLQATRTVPIVFATATDPRSAAAWSRAWPAPGATSLVLPCSNTAQAGNG